MLHRLIVLVRLAREMTSFRYVMHFGVVSLMLIGAWVATRELNMPPEYNVNDKIIHILVFFGFAGLIDLSVRSELFWLWKGLPLLIYGFCIEIMQYYTPERSFSMVDWGADFIGVLAYFIMKKLLVLASLK
jgi:VanZ family protein